MRRPTEPELEPTLKFSSKYRNSYTHTHISIEHSQANSDYFFFFPAWPYVFCRLMNAPMVQNFSLIFRKHSVRLAQYWNTSIEFCLLIMLFKQIIYSDTFGKWRNQISLPNKSSVFILFFLNYRYKIGCWLMAIPFGWKCNCGRQ